MSLVLHIDGGRWRAHLREVAAARPGLVPVAKGNGYGFGNARLARKAEWLGCDTLAVGTYAETADVAKRFAGDLVVLTPWRPVDGAQTTSDAEDAVQRRIIHTVGRLEDLRALIQGPGTPRVLLERLTSMKRHGFTARGLREAVAMIVAAGGVQVEGVSVHLPLGDDAENLAELEALMTDVVAAGPGSLGTRAATVWVSHLSPEAVAAIADQYPDVTVRPRIGTELWLGDPGAFRVTATVLDAHPVERGERFGYRRRIIPRTGTLLVVSGGTAHGIGLEAPTGDGSVRARASTLARGGLDALGLAKSPYTVAGKARYFAEPPHMQASMLFLPSGVDVPPTGDPVDVRVRFTATTFDSVDIS